MLPSSDCLGDEELMRPFPIWLTQVDDGNDVKLKSPKTPKRVGWKLSREEHDSQNDEDHGHLPDLLRLDSTATTSATTRTSRPTTGFSSRADTDTSYLHVQAGVHHTDK
jgi:hypothetical protein